ncbi:MAG TPA: serine hydroxymethyltransferase, partial [Chloroflexota bacterium]
MSEISSHADFVFRGDLSTIDPLTHAIIAKEEERQREKLILIPSESLAPPAVRQALASVFTNLYAEGYPALRTVRSEPRDIADLQEQIAYHRRYADRRYYKGTEFANLVEALAQRRIARLFATAGGAQLDPSHVFANVQPLSGAAANNAVYEALLKPGDTLMGMALSHGGHLTHGSEFNRSGKYYRVVSYGVDPSTGRIDYEAVQRLAEEHRPRLIVGGASAYPWEIDWGRLRAAADAVGAYLMADIAHPAGLVVADLFPNPLPHAHVVTFTTHKTLCGPRGAVILTTDPDLFDRVNRAVFPGEQGGPHLNNIAAMAVAFAIAATEPFRQLQARTVANARALADALAARGLTLAYGGTSTHLLLVDLNALSTPTGVPLKGDVASRVLDLVGIVCNKNTIPGDANAAHSSAVRFGTTWVSQRGLREEHMERLAEVIAETLTSIHPFTYDGLTTLLYRGRIEVQALRRGRERVRALVREAAPEPSPLFAARDVAAAVPAVAGAAPRTLDEQEVQRAVREGALVLGPSTLTVLRVRGPRAGLLLQGALTADVLGLPPTGARRAAVLDPDGRVIDDVTVLRVPRESDDDHFLLVAHAVRGDDLRQWLADLSDGYVLVDREDLYVKLEGPAVVVDADDVAADADRLGALVVLGPSGSQLLGTVVDGEGLASGTWRSVSADGLPLLVARTPYGEGEQHLVVGHPRHLEALRGRLLDRAADQPVVVASAEDLRVVRQALGLPPYGERPTGPALLATGLVQLDKPYFVGQQLLAAQVTPPPRSRVEPRPYEGEARPTPLFEEHRALLRGQDLVPFGGWLLPVWYRGIAAEHRAVRTTAALFDLSHMGVLGVRGAGATRFLDLVATNSVQALPVGQGQYSYLLDEDGNVLDDIFLYRLEPERYVVVVNAANAEKDLAWLQAIAHDSPLLDPDVPWRQVDARPEVVDLRAPSAGDERLVNVALQGPRSLDVLLRLASDERDQQRLRQLRRLEFAHVRLAGVAVMVARTGYTGEEYGYE